MTPKSTTTDLAKQSHDDLRRDVKHKRAQVARMRLHLELKKEKNSAAYRREKKEIARMLTSLSNRKGEALPKPASSRKVSA